MPTTHTPGYRGHSLLLLLPYLVLIVYGSFIPFEWREHSLDEAIRIFADIPWLDLSIVSRADWVANLVLYAPLGFFGCAAIASASRSLLSRLLLSMIVLAVCLGVAISVEFTQIFFAPRTVSLNDLVAETIGSTVGIVLWISWHERLERLSQDFRAGGRRSLVAATSIYAALYLALAMFPYDFVISLSELSEKVASGQHGLLLASWDDNPVRILVRLFGEAFAIAPLGFLMGLLAGRIGKMRVFVFGLLLGIALEAAQFLLYSGVTQGASVLMRGIGLATGALVGEWLLHQGLLPLARWTRRLTLPLVPFYIAALLAVSGWLNYDLVAGPTVVLDKLAEQSWLPFYYHYYTTEPVAMASLLANFAMYAPLGLIAWARHTSIPLESRMGAWQPARWAVLLAALIESSKLLLDGARPDPTNLLIAAGGAVTSYLVAIWIGRLAQHAHESPEDAEVVAPEPQPEEIPAHKSNLEIPPPATLGAAAILVAGLLVHPLALWLLPLYVAYAVLLWRQPIAWLWALPAALPVLDFAPLAGRQLLDAFDLLVLTTLAVGYWRWRHKPAHWWDSGAMSVGVLLLLASTLASLAIGLRPLLDGAAPTLAMSHSPLEAWMVAKGMVWALLLLPLLLKVPRKSLQRAGQWLVAGLASGLMLLSLFVLLERHVFVGIADTDNVFRVTGTFSAMYNGGAYIEAFIALAFPALVIWALEQQRLVLRLLGLGFAALASYAMLVTFSRGGYAGLALAVLVLAFNLLRLRRRGRRTGGWLFAGILLAGTAAAMPVLLGGFAQQRLNDSLKDLQTRLDHWQHALSITDKGVLSLLAGTGFGQYPNHYLWQNRDERPPGVFGLQQEGKQRFLRLVSGDNYYLDQLVGLDKTGTYRLRARLRYLGSESTLRIPVCEKALLYSFSCQWHDLDRPKGSSGNKWVEVERKIKLAGFAQTGRWPSPPLKLSLAGPTREGAIDIAWIRLFDESGNDLLRNGDFSKGLNHWLPATDRDLAWHIHQTQIEVFFAQGLLGLLAVGMLLLAAIPPLAAGMRLGQPVALSLGAGLAGYLAVSLLGSTLDTARLGLGFFLALFCAKMLSTNEKAV